MQIVGEVERTGPIGRAEFAQRYLHPARPVIITGAIESWAARRTWTPELLGARLGSVRVSCKYSPTHVHPDFAAGDLAAMFATRELCFAELLSQLRGPDGASWFMTGEEEPLLRMRPGTPPQRSPLLGSLLSDVETPPYFDEERLYTVWTWFSAAGARSWLHYDNNGCHNLNAQIRGAKRFWLFPPAALDGLYPYELDASPPAHNCSRVDLRQPDLRRFPLFARMRALEGELLEGELLFLPAFWFHGFLHTGPFNANINFWWTPETLELNPVSERWAWLKALASALCGEPSAGAGPRPCDLARLPADSLQLLRKLDAGLCSARERRP